MSGKIKNAETVIYILIAVLLAYIFKKAAASPLNEAGTFHGLNYNLFVYIAAVLIAFVLYLVLMGLTDYLSGTLFWSDIADPEAPGKGSMLRRILFILYIAAAASVLILVYQIYVNENNLYPENTAATFLRQEVPHPVYFGVITVLSLVLLLSLKTAKQEEEKLLSALRAYARIRLFLRGSRILSEHPEGHGRRYSAHPRRDQFCRKYHARSSLRRPELQHLRPLRAVPRADCISVRRAS